MIGASQHSEHVGKCFVMNAVCMHDFFVLDKSSEKKSEKCSKGVTKWQEEEFKYSGRNSYGQILNSYKRSLATKHTNNLRMS